MTISKMYGTAGDAGTAGHEKYGTECSGGKKERLFHTISFRFSVAEIKINTILILPWE